MCDSNSPVEGAREILLKEFLSLREKSLKNQSVINAQKQQVNERLEELSGCSTHNQEVSKQYINLKAIEHDKQQQDKDEYATLATSVEELTSRCNEQYAEEENKLVEMQKQLADCKESINSMEQVPSHSGNRHMETNSTEMLKNHISDLKTQVGNLKIILQTQVVKHEELLTKVKTTQAEVSTLQKQCDHNKDAINKATALTENLEVEVITLKKESLTLGNKQEVVEQIPNSLFNEANVNRTTIYDNVSKIYNTCVEIKNKRTHLMKQLETLQHVKTRLESMCEDVNKDRSFDKFVIKNIYKDFIAIFVELDKELDYLIEQRNLIENKTITPKESDWFFKIFNNFDDNIRILEDRVGKERHANSMFKFKISQQRNEIEELTKKMKEKQKINDKYQAIKDMAEESEVNDHIICICSLQKQEK